MNTNVLKPLTQLIFTGLLLSGIYPITEIAAAPALTGNVVANFNSVPVNLTGNNATPLVMINASKDHQLFFKAYNDYSDMDPEKKDGIETTYKPSISYYGYFDSSKCYNYSTANKRFEPTLTDTDSQHYCVTSPASQYWSGNFLNWISMARIDVIRKVLFGGHRRVDTDTSTVLERTYLPHDAHSWAKYYDGNGRNDIHLLTPFTSVEYTNADPKNNGITFANTTDTDSNDFSQNITDPPLIKVAKGNYTLWAGNERWQCTWDSGSPMDNHSSVSNSNDSTKSKINAYSGNPPWSARLGEGNYVARVQACVKDRLGDEKCKLYPGPDGVLETTDDIYKPVGLLQVYGDDDQMYFGMIAGTYNKHASGGDVIRNVASMRDEIDVDHSGTFSRVSVDAGGTMDNNGNGASAPMGLINAWSLYRIVGYSHDDGTYNKGNPGDNCTWGLSAISDVTADNRCVNWGNPFSEIYYQSINYFAGGGVIGQYHSNSSTAINGLPTPQNFTDPLTNTNRCARLSIVNFNSSIASYDADELDGNSYGPPTIWASSDLPTSGTSSAMTDVVGSSTKEGINGHSYFVGSVATGDNELCTAKTVTSWGAVLGLCPDAPRLKGSYRIAGLAYYAHVKDIRPSTATGNRNLAGSQTVDTYSVSMSTAVPAVDIINPKTGLKAVTILPACRNTGLNPNGNCALVDFKIVEQTSNATTGIGTGQFYINWEDSEQGGDYDQDMWGRLSYTIDGNTNKITVTTDVVAQSTSYSMGFGYVISGTTQDGFHAHSGIFAYTYNDPATLTAGTNCAAGCQPGDAPSTAQYTLGTATTTLLHDPLWYASKWGGFTDTGSGTIDSVSDWDKVNNATGVAGADGIPDTYFYANDPTQLEDSLNRVFLAILQRPASGTAAAVVSNNVSGIGALYQAYYEPLRQDSAGNQASWIGTVQSLWLDNFGYLREEGNGPVSGSVFLGDYNTDPVIELFYDDQANKTRARRYVSTKSDVYAPYYMKGTVTAVTSGSVSFTVNEISDDHTGSGPFNDWTVYNLTAGTTWASNDTATMASTTGGVVTFTVSTVPPTGWFTVGQKIMVAHFQSTIAELSEIRTIWNARQQLSGITDTATTSQRVYSATADGTSTGGRFIKTWIDGKGTGTYNGRVDHRVSGVGSEEFVDFTRLSIDSSNIGYFNMAPVNNSTNLDIVRDLVDYIRGKEIAKHRSRIVNYDGHGTQVMRLGDVVNSTPTVVGAPQEEFDLLYKDPSYAVFKKQYAKRRQMVYVGSNDGMLHAFNGGFYNSEKKAFMVSGFKYNSTTSSPLPVTEHPLGAEIWAYVPMNLLPHLQWLKDPNYSNTTHVYYVDGKPKIFDAKIFTKDADHPGLTSDTKGWGTILVVGMRFGGGAYKTTGTTTTKIDTAADGSGSGHTADDVTLSSAFIIMDITNPEVEPMLLGEIPVPDGSFSTGYPAVMAVKQKNPTTPLADANKWFLIFGSGPDNTRAGLTFANSTKTAKIHLLDLEEIFTPNASSTGVPPTIVNGSGSSGYTTSCSRPTAGTKWNILTCNTGIASTFVGDAISVDWDLNYKADSVYFGLLGDQAATSGRVMRMGIRKNMTTDESADPANWLAPKTLINTTQPVVAGVTPGVDENNKKWIFFGTGRFFVTADQTNSPSTQAIYGVKEADAGLEAEVNKSTLLNVSNAQVATNGGLTGVTTTASTPIVPATIAGLEAEIAKTTNSGWYMNLPLIQGSTGAPATRVINQSALTGGVLFTTAYQPGVDTCAGEGFSRLYGLYYKTGTAYPSPTVFGKEYVSGVERAKAFIELGFGFASTPTVHTGSGTGDDAVSVFTQLSTGAIIRTEANTIFGVRSGMDSWKVKSN